jgi:acyl-CoA reductase-like NAD-dependent aldehyde dehydrogenase
MGELGAGNHVYSLRVQMSLSVQGARIECGGERVTVAGFEGGWFVSPAVVTGVSDSARIMREEVFGAAACVVPFDEEEEVVRRANDTEFGLAGGVFTK